MKTDYLRATCAAFIASRKFFAGCIVCGKDTCYRKPYVESPHGLLKTSRVLSRAIGDLRKPLKSPLCADHWYHLIKRRNVNIIKGLALGIITNEQILIRWLSNQVVTDRIMIPDYRGLYCADDDIKDRVDLWKVILSEGHDIYHLIAPSQITYITKAVSKDIEAYTDDVDLKTAIKKWLSNFHIKILLGFRRERSW